MSQGFTRGVPIDTDPNLSLDSDLVVPSQKAVKDYIDTGLNTKQDTITLTTTGTSGAATLTGATLNIPQYGSVTPSALTKVDDTNVTLTLGGTPSTALLQPSSLTLGWTGQLAVSRGGTGLSTIGTSTQYLRVNVPGTALEYATFPVVPSPVSVFPYQRTNYFKPSDNRDLEYYNNNLFLINNSGNNVQVVNSQTTLTTVTTTGISSANQSSVITDLATPEVWVTSNLGVITRHNANTGAFIANTTPTGSVTNAAGSRYVSYSATKSIGGNGTNIFTINPATFVTANLAAHGIGAIVPHLDLNKNPSSAQNDHVMMGGPNGIILFNCLTNAIVLAATTLSGAIGPVYDIKYDPSNNNWIVVCTISGVIKIVYLRPLTATTFSVIKTIDTYSIFGGVLTPGNTQNIKIDFDTTNQYLFVMSYSRLYMYDLSNGNLLRTLNAIMLTGGNIQSASAIDTANKRLFFCTGGAGNSITYEYVYA